MIWGLANKKTYEIATDKNGQAMVFLARNKVREAKKKLKNGEEYKIVNLCIMVDDGDYFGINDKQNNK